MGLSQSRKDKMSTSLVLSVCTSPNGFQSIVFKGSALNSCSEIGVKVPKKMLRDFLLIPDLSIPFCSSHQVHTLYPNYKIIM